MKNAIWKFSHSVFFRAIITVLLLNVSVDAFSLSTQAIQNPPTYQGTFKGEPACNTTYHVTGYEPVDPNAPSAKYPLFLYFTGTRFDDTDAFAMYTSIAAQAVTAAMASRGFVAVSVEYDNKYFTILDNSGTTAGMQNKLAICLAREIHRA